MKLQSGSLVLMAAIFIAACAPAAPVAEFTTTDIVVEENTPLVTTTLTTADSTAPEVVVSEISFNQNVWPIIEQYALAAHGGNGGVFLENYDDIMKYVTPGDPENSMLYKELIGDGVKRMPPNAPLPDELIQTIYDWIKQGAKNN